MCCNLPSGQWSKVLGIHLLPRRPWENKYEHQLIVSVENERTYERVKPSGCMSALIILRSVTGPMAAKVIEEKPSNVNEIKWLQRMLKKWGKRMWVDVIEVDLLYFLYHPVSLREMLRQPLHCMFIPKYRTTCFVSMLVLVQQCFLMAAATFWKRWTLGRRPSRSTNGTLCRRECHHSRPIPR